MAKEPFDEFKSFVPEPTNPIYIEEEQKDIQTELPKRISVCNQNVGMAIVSEYERLYNGTSRDNDEMIRKMKALGRPLTPLEIEADTPKWLIPVIIIAPLIAGIIAIISCYYR